MTDDAPRALRCLIEGESSLFMVKPTGSMDILELKYLIQEQGKNGVLSSVDATELVIWKLRMSMARESTTNFPAG
jgi:hypothetical protein